MLISGEIYTAGKNVTLRPPVTNVTSGEMQYAIYATWDERLESAMTWKIFWEGEREDTRKKQCKK